MREGPVGESRAIFITGGGSGIGRAIAILFAGRGWQIGLGDVDARGMAETAALLPAGALTYALDVCDRPAWARVLGDFVGKTGRLDVLVNNAGIATGGALASMTDGDIDRVIAINFTGVVNGARAGHGFLKATPGSVLLNVASASAIWGSPGLSVYSATKFAVRGLTEALDGEWTADGIKVASLMPGFIDTPLLRVNVAGSNRTARDGVVAGGFEFTPVERVAEAAWDAVHGDRLHTPVGPTAKRLTFAARWLPGKLRRQMKARRRQ